MIYLQLFYEFFIIGLFTFGGGLATIPYLKHLAEKTGWYEVSFITDMIAISESTPGPIGINMATYVGNEIAGIFGGILATVSEILPSIIIVALVSKFLSKFRNNQNFDYAFYGIRPCIEGMLTYVGIDLLSGAVLSKGLISAIGVIGSINILKLVVFLAILYSIMKFRKHPVTYIVISGIIGVILKL
ncbi:chromate transporter [Sedimentibacter sp.]|uniref:chromate transporter n=1 Tax=Sedimentibacter sp. TaxID=1960295 RepID=UPI00289B8335|nr:chromate transporter [Sedimentibacter sp.]